MALNIYDKNGILKLTVEPADSSTHQHAIQEDNVLNLSFVIPEYVMLDVNDYVEFDGSRYWIIEQYVPQQKSTVEWSYSCKFYGIESLINQRGIVIKMVDDEMETVFALTAPARQHMALLVDNINRIFETTDFKVGEVIATENIHIDYNSTYITDALSELAKQAGTEWWFDGMTANLIRCEHGGEITLGYMNGLTKLERTTANNVKFFTRLYPLGSTRNIDFSTYGYSRLQLPNGEKYVEQNVATYGIIEYSEENSFSHIYPRRVGVISAVRSEEKTGTDGELYKIYYFKDADIPFDPNDYEIGGLVKHVQFESGELNGRDFEVNYDSSTQEFEIVTQFPEYSEQIPNDILIPEIGNKYVLWNIEMPDEYITLAEQEFKEAVDAYMSDNDLDKSVYKGPTDYIEIAKRGVKLTIGQRIRLESNEFFPGIGYRSSRITRITRYINNPTQMDIEVSDVLSVGKVTALQNSVLEIKTIIESTREGLPDIIKTWEGTPASDWNLFSALRVLKEIQARALSRLYDDIASGHITFKSGFTAEEFATFYKGIVKEYLSSETFVPGFLGEGFKIYDSNGKWTAEFDNVVVRQSMTIYELIVSKIRAVNGGLVISPANGRIKSVSKTDGDPAYYVLGIEGDMQFVTGDLVRCQVFTSNSLKSYWVEVKQVNGDNILCLVSDFNGSIPAVGDDLVQFGNTTNVDRQGVLYLTASEDGKPRIQILDGVNTTNLTGKNKTILGCLDGITDTDFPAEYQPSGYGLWSENAWLKGIFILRSGKTVEQTIDGIQVGGRNYIQNSKTKEITDGTFLSDKLIIDQTYTLSIERSERVSGTGEEMMRVHDVASGVAYGYIPISNSKQSLTFTAKSGTVTIYATPRYTGTNRNNIYNVKLEKGNKATDWTPAPEDTEVSITELKTELTAVPGQITAAVSGVKTDVSALATRVSSAEAKITPDAIKLTVKSQTETIANAAVNSIGRMYVRGTGYNNSNAPQVIVNNTTYFGNYHRGHSLVVIRRSDLSKVESLSYDTYTSTTYCDSLATKLNSLSSDVIVVIVTYDACAVNANLATAIKRCGGFGYTWGADRIPYAFVGIPGIGEARGVEIKKSNSASDLYAEYSGIITNGVPSGINTSDSITETIKSQFTITSTGISLLGQNLAFTGISVFKSVQDTANAANSGLSTLKNSLKSLAYLDAVGLAKLDSTIIEGGYIKTRLIDVETLVVRKIEAATGTFSRIEGTSGSNSMLLTPYLLRFIGSYSSLFIGAETAPATIGGSLTLPIRLTVNRSVSYSGQGNAGIFLSVQGSTDYDDILTSGNHALFIEKGDICGFRLRTRRVGTSQTLNAMDSIILVTASSNITITLPASPETGQIYFIRKMAAGNVIVTPGSSSHKICNGYNSAVTSVTITNGSLGMFFWDRFNLRWTANWAGQF